MYDPLCHFLKSDRQQKKNTNKHCWTVLFAHQMSIEDQSISAQYIYIYIHTRISLRVSSFYCTTQQLSFKILEDQLPDECSCSHSLFVIWLTGACKLISLTADRRPPNAHCSEEEQITAFPILTLSEYGAYMIHISELTELNTSETHDTDRRMCFRHPKRKIQILECVWLN